MAADPPDHPEDGDSPISGHEGGGVPVDYPFPIGPDTIQELMDFTTQVVQHVLSSPDRDRFLRNIKRTVCLRTEYSGYGSEAMGFFWVAKALVHLGVLGEGFKWIDWYSACDSDRQCQSILKACRGDKRPTHIFKDILDRHPAEVRKELDKVQWGAATKKQHIAKGERDEDDVVMLNAKSIDIEEGPSDLCCPTTSTESGLEHILDAILKTQALLSSPDAFSIGDKAHCVLHDGPCPWVPSSKKPWRAKTINMVTAGASTKPSMSFFASLGPDDVDAAIVECAPEYDTSLLDSLGHDFEVHQMHSTTVPISVRLADRPEAVLGIGVAQKAQSEPMLVRVCEAHDALCQSCPEWTQLLRSVGGEG